MRQRLRALTERILLLQDTPHRISLAFGLGVWFAFFPLGTHTAVSLAVGFAFGLSRAALLLGNWACNPWTIAPMYLAGTTLGCVLLGVPTAEIAGVSLDVSSAAAQAQLLETAGRFLWPFLVGNAVLGAATGAIAYALVKAYIERRRAGRAGEAASQAR